MNKKLQSFGKTLLFPISLLSFMAIFLGVSAALQNQSIINIVPFLGNDTIQAVLGLIRKIAGIPFTYLPLLFAMSIAFGMVKKDKEVATYSAAIGYIAMLVSMSFVLSLKGITADTTSVDALMASGMDNVDATVLNSLYTTSLGIFGYNMNVIGGIIAGLITVTLHNRFRQHELPEALSFYSGKRFVPIITVLSLTVVGAMLVYIWPLVNNAIIAAGSVISSLGVFSAFAYGALEKLINPTGLHHILNQTFRFTALGGMETVNGENVVGALNIYLAQLDSGTAFSPEATMYLAQGRILHMVFGMPAAVLAMYHTALPEKRNKVLKFFIPGLVAVVLTGITEPIEFTFIFISPLLYLLNAFLMGISQLIPAVLGVTIGNIQGGLIDWFVFGVLQGTSTKWYIYLWWGPIMFAVYYFAFRFTIIKFNIGTLGRNESDFSETEEDEKVSQNQSDEDLAKLVVDGLGGIENIVEVDNCISRLRVEIKDNSKVNQDLIKKTNPNGIIEPDKNNVHIVYGGRITKVRNVVDDYMS
ncbi:PTS transporter subunit EIIC [Mollicutes bacterium LVI A0078]|nr:PTS transporter subunit EIIC [Mollicutes bacterium LVI A0075]WOO91397.1 PTS transporter subunit EIIC [Mollicutes bacterium LVI A0078]